MGSVGIFDGTSLTLLKLLLNWQILPVSDGIIRVGESEEVEGKQEGCGSVEG